MVERVSETARAFQWAFAAASAVTTDPSHDTEIKPWICETADGESTYNERHL
jgi:hypothetical protein